MQIKKTSTIFQYIGWLLKTYHDQQTLNADIYRIAEVKHGESSEIKFVIQVIGKSIFIEHTPQEIVLDDAFMDGFSKRDIRTITFYAYQALTKPKYKIVLQNLSAKLNRVLFKLKLNGTETAIEKTAGEITMDKDLINGLSQEDVSSVSFVAGCEHGASDREGMRAAKEEGLFQ